jgi:hypothetical protein
MGAVVAAIGGALVVVGTLLELASAEYALDSANSIRLSATYLDTDDGKIVMAVGIVIVVVALATLVWQVSNGVTAIVLTGGGLAALGFAIYDRFHLDTAHGNLSFGAALYVVMAGGVIAAIGGFLTSGDGSVS